MKYIDSEKLIAEIKRQIESAAQKADIFYSVDDVENKKKYDDERNVLERLLKLVTSLQQEQPQLPGIEEPGIPGKDFIPVEWVDACEMYGKWKIVKLDQPEVNIEKEITEHAINMPHCELSHDSEDREHEEWAMKEFLYFYELGLNARKEE